MDNSTCDGFPRSVMITGSVAAERLAALTSWLKSRELMVDIPTSNVGTCLQYASGDGSARRTHRGLSIGAPSPLGLEILEPSRCPRNRQHPYRAFLRSSPGSTVGLYHRTH